MKVDISDGLPNTDKLKGVMNFMVPPYCLAEVAAGVGLTAVAAGLEATGEVLAGAEAAGELDVVVVGD